MILRVPPTPLLVRINPSTEKVRKGHASRRERERERARVRSGELSNQAMVMDNREARYDEFQLYS